ncbi:MAG: glycosyltransferase family 4 protein [Candidatus Odinarchaeum yellowstonii]|uniref:Glycosyltransferase family 4 protein n=1 Tax=Odinarchaeota yellowstonii (strain LCB_4) TaxID=1841599 RepID=A0AAF0D1P5_ODILC|nr:MAG: glycosyltransferase family 4 protein [Candidatus Odinarchaeum yellowstonii]
MTVAIEEFKAVFSTGRERFIWLKNSDGWVLEGIYLGGKKLAWEKNPGTLIVYEKNTPANYKLTFNQVEKTGDGLTFTGSNNLCEFKKTWIFKNETPKLVFSFRPKKQMEIDLLEAPILVYGPSNISYSFVGGLRYAKNNLFDVVNRVFNFPYPFSTYYKVKIPPRKVGDSWYRSLIYCKMPLALYASRKYYFGLIFNPVEKTNLGRELLHSIRFDGAGLKNENIISLSYCSHMIYSKKNIWLGLPAKPRPLRISLNPSEEVYTTAYILYGAGKWYDGVDAFFKVNPLPEDTLPVDPKIIAEKTKNAFWRAWESRLKTFLQLPFKRSPEFLFDNLLFSLTSFDSERLSNFYDYYILTGDPDFKYWINNLRNNLLSRRIIEIKNNYKIWHTGIAFNGVNGEGYTYLWTGYAGYPGGQATIVLRLLEYYYKKLQSVGLNDRRVLNNALDGLDWIISTQKPNGAWRSALKIFKEYPARRIDYSLQESVGGTAECIRALTLAFKITGETKYKEAALKGLKWLNGKSETVLGYNYLRDAGVFEEEGVSAIIAAQANLDAYEVFNDEKYYKYALIWGKYLLTWHYLWESDKLKIRYGFDPLSWSITPRVAPYETAMVLSVYSRLYKLTGNPFWKRIFINTYLKLSEFQEADGGLSETFFFNYLHGLADIPVQQTFAANELLKSSLECMNLDKNIRFNVEKDKITVIERNPLLKEVTKSGDIIQIKLVNESDYKSHLFKLSSNILDKSSVFIDGKEIVSRRGCEIYGLQIPAKSKQQITVKLEPSKSPQITMIGVEDYTALYEDEHKTVKIEYKGKHPQLYIKNILLDKVSLTFDGDKKTLTQISRGSFKTFKLNLPPGSHRLEVYLSEKTDSEPWFDNNFTMRIPILIYPNFATGADESLVKFKAEKITLNMPFNIKKSLIKFVKDGEEIPFHISGETEILEKNDEIILKLSLSKPVAKIYMYYGSPTTLQKSGELKTRVEDNIVRVYGKKGERWLNYFNVKQPEIEVNHPSGGGLSFKLSFWDVYSNKSRFISAVRRALRKYAVRLLLGVENIKDVLYGVADRKQPCKQFIQPLNQTQIKKFALKTDYAESLNCAFIDYRFETDLHRIISKIYVLKKAGKVYFVFNPLKIRVLQEDLKGTRQVYAPLITGKFKEINQVSDREVNLVLESGGVVKWLLYNCERTTGSSAKLVKINDNSLGVDVTLKTNWVHAGEYHQYSAIILDESESKEVEEDLKYLVNFASTDYIPGTAETRESDSKIEPSHTSLQVKPLKVALIYPGAAHGIYHYVRHLRNILGKQNIIFKGFYFPEEKATKPMASSDKPLETKLRIGEFYFVLPDKKATKTILEEEYLKDKFDIIHLHWPTTTWDSYVFEFAEKYNIPLCVNLHYALSLRDDGYGILSRLMYNISKAYLRKADRIIVTSKAQESFVKSLGYPSVVHIPTGVDIEYFKPGLKTDSRIKTVLYVGRISPEKNVEAAIKAFKKCGLRDTRLVIVGKGPLLKSLRRKYRGENIIFTGYISEAEKLKYLQNADLFVTATKMELMSIAVLEAMASGLPVITSRLDAFEEFVTRDVGRMIELNNNFVDNLAATMRELLDNDNLRKVMGAEARRKVVNLCSWQRISERIKKLYESLIS